MRKPTWLEKMQSLRSAVHYSLHQMGEEYRGLEDKDRKSGKVLRRGIHVRFENERRGAGRGHGLRTELVEGTKSTIRALLRTHDLPNARESFDALKTMKEELFKIEMPERDLHARAQESDQELVECSYYIDLFPAVFFGGALPAKWQDPDDLNMHPAVFLNGLLDVMSELLKSVGDYLLEAQPEEYGADLIFDLKARCIGVCEGLWAFLDEYEYVYGGVIDLSRCFGSKYKSKLRRQADGIRRMKESLLELRERQLTANK